MKHGLLITSAGISSRFSSSLGRESSKIIYHEGDPRFSLLGYQLRVAEELDIGPVILVLGYRSDEIGAFATRYFPHLDLHIVFDERYRDWGSGYSLLLGVRKAKELEVEQATFLEGDLVFERQSLKKIVDSDRSVVTVQHELIRSDRAVVVYTDTGGLIHYVYDTNHASLSIPVPFTKLGNSAQIWKFHDAQLLYSIAETQEIAEHRGTNLVLVERYFQRLDPEKIAWVEVDGWVNCNTVEDYRQALPLMQRMYR